MAGNATSAYTVKTLKYMHIIIIYRVALSYKVRIEEGRIDDGSRGKSSWSSAIVVNPTFYVYSSLHVVYINNSEGATPAQ